MVISRKFLVTTFAAFAMILSPLFLVSPVLAAASPALAEAPVLADDGRIHLNFVKWIAGFPHMEGEVEGVPGTYTGEVLSRKVSPDGRIVQLEALYSLQWRGHSFTARIKGRQILETCLNQLGVLGPCNSARLDGKIISGWLKGAEVHVDFDVVTCPTPASSPQCSLSGGAPLFFSTMSITPNSDKHDNDRERRDDR